MEHRPRICIIHTGGTFGMSGHPGPLRPDSYSHRITDWIPGLSDIARISLIAPFNIDSSQMEPARWIEIARAIETAYPKQDGFVVIHGTDSMAYTAAALSFMLEGLDKPVILTGSQLPLVELRTDARGNLVNAVILAGMSIPEVGVCFDNKLYRGTRIQKQDIWSYAAFNSPNLDPLAELGLAVKLFDHVMPAREGFRVDTRIDPGIMVVRIVPGLDPALLINLLRNGIRGLVLEAFGAGNLPVSHPGFLEMLREATRRSIPVLIVSQSPRGAVDLKLYEAGQAATTAGVIPGGDMTVECAAVKLMIALGRYGDLQDIRSFLMAPVVGERSV